ncbi:hypothetical protein GGR52DRAFT_132321 [Hypoxylon sp. FL1284]|nr:hypothetical protein GGR52DRAFT_132321 [Hypoxylon sp. FL1284]
MAGDEHAAHTSSENFTTAEHNVRNMFGHGSGGPPGPSASLPRRQQATSLAPLPVPLQPLRSQTPSIPEWFPIMRANINGYFPAKDDAAAYKLLLHLLCQYQREVEYRERHGDPKQWDKFWHEPSKNWPHEHQRLKGGWWKCRSEPDAPEAQRRCIICHRGRKKQADQPPEDPKAELDFLMGHMQSAMEEVARMDQAVVRQLLN